MNTALVLGMFPVFSAHAEVVLFSESNPFNPVRILRTRGGSSFIKDKVGTFSGVFSAHAEVVPRLNNLGIAGVGILRARGGSHEFVTG